MLVFLKVFILLFLSFLRRKCGKYAVKGDEQEILTEVKNKLTKTRLIFMSCIPFPSPSKYSHIHARVLPWHLQGKLSHSSFLVVFQPINKKIAKLLCRSTKTNRFLNHTCCIRSSPYQSNPSESKKFSVNNSILTNRIKSFGNIS